MKLDLLELENKVRNREGGEKSKYGWEMFGYGLLEREMCFD